MGNQISNECRTLCEGRKELDNAVDALETELCRLATTDRDKRTSLNDEILALLKLVTAKLQLRNALCESHKGLLFSEGEIRELIGEIKDLETKKRHRQTAIRALEATIRLVDQQSKEAVGSLDTKISQKTALLLVNKKSLIYTINQINAKMQLLIAFITIKKGILSSEGDIQEKRGEINDLLSTIRHRQTTICVLEAAVQKLETDQQSADQANSSLDTKISERTALLVAYKKSLIATTLQATAKAQLLAALITYQRVSAVPQTVKMLLVDHWEGATCRKITVGEAIPKVKEEIRKLKGELKNLEPTLQPIHSAISDLEATIGVLETDQHSANQAVSSLDTKISENIALLLAQYEALTDATEQITTVMDDIIRIIGGIDVKIRLAIAVNRNRPRPIITRPVNPVPAVPKTKGMTEPVNPVPAVPPTKGMTDLGKQIVAIHRTV